MFVSLDIVSLKEKKIETVLEFKMHYCLENDEIFIASFFLILVSLNRFQENSRQGVPENGIHT